MPRDMKEIERTLIQLTMIAESLSRTPDQPILAGYLSGVISGLSLCLAAAAQQIQALDARVTTLEQQLGEEQPK